MLEVKIHYRKLRHYKYQIMQDYTIQIGVTPNEEIVTDFIILTTTGKLTIKGRYAWDGPSGPTIDTKTFMRGSLVHDALYQMMRERYLDQSYRADADDLLKVICLEDGMSPIRAWYVHKSVQLFAEAYAKPSSKPRSKLNSAP